MLGFKLKENKIKDAWIARFGQMAGSVTERNWEKTSELNNIFNRFDSESFTSQKAPRLQPLEHAVETNRIFCQLIM